MRKIKKNNLSLPHISKTKMKELEEKWDDLRSKTGRALPLLIPIEYASGTTRYLLIIGTIPLNKLQETESMIDKLFDAMQVEETFVDMMTRLTVGERFEIVPSLLVNYNDIIWYAQLDYLKQSGICPDAIFDAAISKNIYHRNTPSEEKIAKMKSILPDLKTIIAQTTDHIQTHENESPTRIKRPKMLQSDMETLREIFHSVRRNRQSHE